VYCCSRVGFWSLYLKFVGGLSRFDNRPHTEMDAKSEPGWRGRTEELTSVLFVAHAARAGVSRIKWLVAFSEINGGRCHVKTCDFVACPLLGRPLSYALRLGADRGPDFGCDLGDRHDRRVRMAGVPGDPRLAGFVSVFHSGHARLGHRRIHDARLGILGVHESQRTEFRVSTSGTRENTQSFGTSVSPSSGTYYLVVDNIDVSSSGAPGSAPVTVDVSAQIRPFPILGVVIGVVVVLAIVVAVLLIVRSRRKKKAAMRMMPPPLQPPMGPPQPPLRPPGS